MCKRVQRSASHWTYTGDRLRCCSGEGVDRPRYSLDLAPSNSNLFGPPKEACAWQVLCSSCQHEALPCGYGHLTQIFVYQDTSLGIMGGGGAGADVQMTIVTTWKCGVYHVPCIVWSKNQILALDCLLPCYQVLSICFNSPVSRHLTFLSVDLDTFYTLY